MCQIDFFPKKNATYFEKEEVLDDPAIQGGARPRRQ
jgi:hypothetical protein